MAFVKCFGKYLQPSLSKKKKNNLPFNKNLNLYLDWKHNKSQKFLSHLRLHIKIQAQVLKKVYIIDLIFENLKTYLLIIKKIH